LLDIKGYDEETILAHYDEKQGGQMLVFFNFLGLLEVAISNGSAAQLLGLNRNDKVIIRFGKAI
jgi:S-adenosylmethionine hydrolase